MTTSNGPAHNKDEVLDRLAHITNVAQFVSFDRDLLQRFGWIHGHDPRQRYESPLEAIRQLLAASPERSVNVRSFEPYDPKSREFIYGLTDAGVVAAHVQRLASEGLNTIVNETVDVNDGGVSGVAYGNVVEFAPGDTPRAVEKPGTAALPREFANRAFETIYGFRPVLPEGTSLRVEFSIHPLRRGYRHNHTIVWEMEDLPGAPVEANIAWPNNFSRMVGDKAYGLLVAWLVGLRVPHTRVFARRVGPFEFGERTGSDEVWLRTAPTEQVPGKFTTVRGWTDPFKLMQDEDPSGSAIASILAQHGVEAQWSGALLSQPDGMLMVEGTSGFGDEFMLGDRVPELLPDAVRSDVVGAYHQVSAVLGPVRFEWVHDGKHVWIVQLHQGRSVSQGRVVFPGIAMHWRRFDVSRGIRALRDLIADNQSDGVVLVGRVGVTSHFGDILRRARIPSRIEDE